MRTPSNTSLNLTRYVGAWQYPSPKHPFFAQEPLQEPWFSHLSPLPTTEEYRSVTRLAKARQDSRLR